MTKAACAKELPPRHLPYDGAAAFLILVPLALQTGLYLFDASQKTTQAIESEPAKQSSR